MTDGSDRIAWLSERGPGRVWLRELRAARASVSECVPSPRLASLLLLVRASLHFDAASPLCFSLNRSAGAVTITHDDEQQRRGMGLAATAKPATSPSLPRKEGPDDAIANGNGGGQQRQIAMQRDVHAVRRTLGRTMSELELGMSTTSDPWTDVEREAIPN